MTTEQGANSGGPTFLVVDDDAMVRKIVSRGLAKLDPAEILEVEDGLAAQEILRDRKFDVVVTDVLMPNMSGLELMKWAQEHCPEPLWIVLSGLETFDAAVDALQLGAFDYLAKPPEVQRVRVAVRNALDQIELVRERKRLYEQIELSNAQLAEKVDELEQLCRVLEEQAAVIQSDLDRAEIIQRALLPQEPPEMDGWCAETLYRAGNSVGGDFYDVILLDEDHVGLVVADAAGHGVAAAMLSVLFKLRLNFRARGGELLTPSQVLGSLNGKLHKSISAPGAFITAVYVLLNRRTGHARLASAGHPPCIQTTTAGDSQLLERTGPALGLAAEAQYEECEFHLGEGDRLLLYTDGVLGSAESAVTSEDLVRALSSVGSRAEVPGKLYRAATEDASGERDDITMILLERGQGESHFDDTPTAEQRAAPPPASNERSQLLKGVTPNRAFIHITGTMTWTSSQTLLEAANDLLKSYDYLSIDLGDCDYLDSTCLGTLHEIVMSRPSAVNVQQMPESIRALFEELKMSGVLSRASPTGDALPESMEPLQQVQLEQARQGQRMLRAHEVLASLNPENREKFKGVVDALRTDLDRDE